MGFFFSRGKRQERRGTEFAVSKEVEVPLRSNHQGASKTSFSDKADQPASACFAIFKTQFCFHTSIIHSLALRIQKTAFTYVAKNAGNRV